MTDRKYSFETLQIHGGQEEADIATGSRAVPIYASTSYVFENSEQAAKRFSLEEAGHIYTRLGNPTSQVFEERMALLEGGKGALALASGSTAVYYAITNIAKCNDHIVSSKTLYGGTHNLFANTLKDQGIEVTFVDGNDLGNFSRAIKENTKAIFIESLGNPNSDIIDIEEVAKIAHGAGIPLIVDNTFATPYLLRPIEWGADIVVHSATKFLGGHGTVIGGVVVDGGNFDWAQNDKFPGLSKPNPSYHGLVFSEAVKDIAYIIKMRTTLLRDTGACISPFNSFLLLQGLETLSLRVERHVENTLELLDFLSKHEKVNKVNHPLLADDKQKALYKKYFPKGAGSIFTIELKGSEEDAKKFSESLKLFSLLANVADAKSLVIHPASTTHSQLSKEELLVSGIKPESVRLSIGLENIEDIKQDLLEALALI